MNQNNKITILSTFSKDILLNGKGRVLREQKGGPAFFISNVFRSEGLKFGIIKAPLVEVEIRVTNKGEFGKIENKNKTIFPDFSKIEKNYLLISTILDEFSIDNISDYQGKIFLDIQGYVRNGKKFGKKKMWKLQKGYYNSFYCLKGTEEEIRFLPEELVDIQKNKMLIITRGKRGVDIYFCGKRKAIKPEKVIDCSDTIGAGDTFFAYFLACFSRTENFLKSADYAVSKTCNFLVFKNHHSCLF